MCRALLVAALVAAVPGVLRAEPFTAWESSGDIWARDEATGRTWNLTADWPWAASHPDVAAYTAVFQTSNGGMAAIYGYAFDHRFPVDLFPVYINPYGASVSEPKIGVVSTPGYGDYWVGWRQAGGIWANHLKPPVESSDAFQVLPAYTGWFDVQADQLLYDGGSMTLKDPPPPVTPEPSTLVLLATGTVGLLLVWRRRRRTA